MILFAGGCWASRQVSNGIRYVSVALKPRNSLSSVERIFIVALAILCSTADYSTTGRRNLIPFMGGCWARRQPPNGIEYVPVTSKPRNSLASVERIFTVVVALASFYPTDDYSTTARPILILFAGGCRARCQPPNGIWYVSVASKLMNPPTLLSLVFLKVLELDGRFHHNCLTDSGSDCRRLLVSTPASQLYKILPPATFFHEVTGSQVGVESCAKVEFPVGEGLLMSIMIGPVY